VRCPPSQHPLAVWRRQQQLTCSALASLAETTEASISRIERRRQWPRAQLLRRLREISQLEIADFYE
jgi:transcriptional regulator with XRE-family HTH domain